jgi:hypothetical protein
VESGCVEKLSLDSGSLQVGPWCLQNPAPYDPYAAISQYMRDASSAMAKKVDDAIFDALRYGQVTVSVDHRGGYKILNPHLP